MQTKAEANDRRCLQNPESKVTEAWHPHSCNIHNVGAGFCVDGYSSVFQCIFPSLFQSTFVKVYVFFLQSIPVNIFESVRVLYVLTGCEGTRE